MTHRLDMKHKDTGQRGPRYSVSYNGEVIVAASTSPLGDACRVLASRGIHGRVALYAGEIYPRLTADILRAAAQTVSEGQRTSPRVVPWVPYEATRGRSEDGDDEVSGTLATPDTQAL